MKKNILKFVFALCLILLVSCKDDDVETIDISKVSLENVSGKTEVADGDTLVFRANVDTHLNYDVVWYVNNVKVEGVTGNTFKFTSEQSGNYVIGFVVSDGKAEVAHKLEVTVYGKYRDGVFILNEGNMSNETGILSFINPAGQIIDSIYSKVNGSQLGNVCQDLFICGNKMYIISQNGKKNNGDGFLVVVNAETMKKEAVYNDELSELKWPSHIAVVDNKYAYIRSVYGFHLLNLVTKKLVEVESASGALKNRMAVVGNKVYVPGSECVFVLEGGKANVVDTIKLEAPVSGLIKSADGNLWVSTTGTPHKILKISTKDYKILKTNEVTEGSLRAGWGATPAIGAKGDTIYYSGATTKIYRHIFSTGVSEFMVDVKEKVANANMMYNNLGVHPLTGEVYFNTIEGYGLKYLKNNISVFNFSKKEPQLKNNYQDHTRFPAGIYFTDYFK